MLVSEKRKRLWRGLILKLKRKIQRKRDFIKTQRRECTTVDGSARQVKQKRFSQSRHQNRSLAHDLRAVYSRKKEGKRRPWCREWNSLRFSFPSKRQRDCLGIYVRDCIRSEEFDSLPHQAFCQSSKPRVLGGARQGSDHATKQVVLFLCVRHQPDPQYTEDIPYYSDNKPWLILVQKAFLVGLFSGELIF